MAGKPQVANQTPRIPPKLLSAIKSSLETLPKGEKLIDATLYAQVPPSSTNSGVIESFVVYLKDKFNKGVTSCKFTSKFSATIRTKLTMDELREVLQWGTSIPFPASSAKEHSAAKPSYAEVAQKANGRATYVNVQVDTTFATLIRIGNIPTRWLSSNANWLEKVTSHFAFWNPDLVATSNETALTTRVTLVFLNPPNDLYPAKTLPTRKIREDIVIEGQLFSISVTYPERAAHDLIKSVAQDIPQQEGEWKLATQTKIHRKRKTHRPDPRLKETKGAAESAPPKHVYVKKEQAKPDMMRQDQSEEELKQQTEGETPTPAKLPVEIVNEESAKETSLTSNAQITHRENKAQDDPDLYDEGPLLEDDQQANEKADESQFSLTKAYPQTEEKLKGPELRSKTQDKLPNNGRKNRRAASNKKTN